MAPGYGGHDILGYPAFYSEPRVLAHACMLMISKAKSTEKWAGDRLGQTWGWAGGRALATDQCMGLLFLAFPLSRCSSGSAEL